MTNTAARRRARTLLPRLALLPAAALALVLTACGTEPEADGVAPGPGAITIEDPWVRATTGTEDPTMTAAFMAIDNDGDDDVVLEDAASPVAGTVQLHEMAEVDGTMVMREVDGGITLGAHGGQLLQPGGYHVMLMGLEHELAAGDEVELTLTFSDGRSVEVTAPVKEFTEEEGHYHAPGTGEHSH